MNRDRLKPLFSLDDPHAGPALPLSPDEAERLIASALDEAYSSPSPSPATRWRGALKVGLATVAVVIGAGGVALLRRDSAAGTGPATPVSAAPQASPLNERVERVAVDDAGAVAPLRETKGARREGAIRPSAKASGGSPALDEEPLSDQEWLGAANTARRERRWREADALYSKVVERFPTSPVSAVAALASGELRLELLGDADGARQRFRFATTRGEAHAVDAYEGLLKACTVLGDTRCEDEARAALEARGERTKEKPSPP